MFEFTDKSLVNSIDHSTPSSSSSNSSGLTLNVHSRPFYTQASSSSLPMSSLSISSSSSNSSNSQSPVVLGTMAPSPVSSSSVATVTPPSQQLVLQRSSATSIADGTSQQLPVTPVKESKVIIMNGPTSAGAPESKVCLAVVRSVTLSVSL